MTSIPAFMGKISDLPGARFASFVYRAKGTGELARVVVILGASTENLYLKDIEILKAMIPTLSGIMLEAAEAILASRQTSVAHFEIGEFNPGYTNAETYVRPEGFNNGLMIHKETGTVYVVGLVEDKKVLEAGEYKKVNSRPLTLAKKEVEKALPSVRFRQYILTNVITAKVNGEVLEIQTADEPLAVVAV